MTSERVTVYTARVDPATRAEAYAPTVLAGVSWYCRTEAGVTDGGMKAANVYTLRIPEDVDAGGKAYAAQEAYRRAESVDALWTIQKGDVIVRGDATESGMTPARLRERYGAENVMTVLGVTDNRRAANARHWKVVGA